MFTSDVVSHSIICVIQFVEEPESYAEARIRQNRRIVQFSADRCSQSSP